MKKPISKDIKHSGNDKDSDGDQMNGWQGVEVVRRKEAGATTVELPPEIFVLMESCLDCRWLRKSTHAINDEEHIIPQSVSYLWYCNTVM